MLSCSSVVCGCCCSVLTCICEVCASNSGHHDVKSLSAHSTSVGFLFASSIEYLTGTKDQVEKAAKAYRVYVSKADEHQEGEDYLVDHSIVIYLIAPDGECVDFLTQKTTASVTCLNALSRLR